MKTFRSLLALTLIGWCSCLMGQQLHFNAEGQFKILQLTDTHIGCKADGVQKTLDFIREMISTEKPDMVMFTGDIVVQNNPKEQWDKIAAILAEYKLPWAVTFGNHDDEYDTKRPVLTTIVTAYQGCMNHRTEGVDGESNFVLTVKNNTQTKIAALLYCFDSHAYSRIHGIKGYDWIQLSQLNWYKAQNEHYLVENQNKALPSLAFFHIPFPEYSEIKETKQFRFFGKKNEDVACAKVNGGLFASLLAGGDVMATFVGHDHVNDYIGIHHGIALAYGRFSNPTECPYGKIKAGARVVLLKENERKFDTWIRETGGDVVDKCSFPESFIVGK